MLRTIALCAVVALTGPLAATSAFADRGHGGGKDARAGFCPPGLAKKSPACIPPGQAKKMTRGHDDHDDDHDDDHAHHDDHDGHHDGDYADGYHDGYRDAIRVGARIDDRYTLIRDPGRYGLNPDYYYYRALDSVVRVDPDTRRVLSVIGLVDALLN